MKVYWQNYPGCDAFDSAALALPGGGFSFPFWTFCPSAAFCKLAILARLSTLSSVPNTHVIVVVLAVQGGPKNLAPLFLYALTLPNINRFSKLFHCQNQEKICNNTVTKDPTTPQVCRYTTLWNVSVIKATTKNKTTSVTTHFTKLTTGNNVFSVSVIV